MGLPPKFGKYEIVEMIGRGGMGVIYKARDNVLGRFVALKIMTNDLPAEAEARTRFLREARAASMLQHANIVVVYEFGEDDSRPYIAMEFLDGEPLDHVIRKGTALTLADKTNIVLQVAKALQYAHAKGVIHRDIKPGNIMCMADGTVKVVDFGIAHLADQTITQTGVALGTLPYLAPEQLNGEGVDGRTDIFSLGVVLYQLLTGKLPFEGANTAETISRILLDSPPLLSSECTKKSPELQIITDKALAKKKEARFQTCLEMAEALAQLRARFEERTQLASLDEARPLASLGQATPESARSQHAIAAAVAESKHQGKSPSFDIRRGRLRWAVAIFVFIGSAAILSGFLTHFHTPSSSLPLNTNWNESSTTSPRHNGQVTLIPTTVRVISGSRLDFSATVSGAADAELIWSVREGDAGGSVVPGSERSRRGAPFRAVYFAPATPGTYHVVVSTKAEPHMSAVANVTVTPLSIKPSMAPPKQGSQSASPFEVR